SPGSTSPTIAAPSGATRLLPASGTLRLLMPIARPVSFSATVARRDRILRIVDGTKRNRPYEICRRCDSRQAQLAFEDRRLTGEVPVPFDQQRSERANRTIRAERQEARLGGWLSRIVERRPAVTGHARRCRHESILGDGISEPDIQADIAFEVGLRSLQAVI